MTIHGEMAMQQLKMLSQKRLSAAQPEEVVATALEVWFGETTPTLSELFMMSNHEQATAGYLLDRLSRFNCVSVDRKYQYQQLCQALFNRLKPYPNSTDDVDVLASRWGLSSDLKPFRHHLLPYQTRDYQRRRKASVSAA